MARTDVSTSTSIGLLILRIGFGVYLATHGWGKVQMLLDGQSAQFGDPIGIGAMPSLVLATLAEFACSLLVVVGLATRLAAIPVVITMGVAAFVVHSSDPWTMQPTGPSKEPALLYLTAFLALAFTGAGRYSLDHAWWGKGRDDGGP
jgi:putative oxidoreductase